MFSLLLSVRLSVCVELTFGDKVKKLLILTIISLASKSTGSEINHEFKREPIRLNFAEYFLQTVADSATPNTHTLMYDIRVYVPLRRVRSFDGCSLETEKIQKKK